MIINSHFHKAIEAKQHEPFAWGVNDCCLFAADVYGIIYDKDFAEGIRGTYDNEYDGMRKVVELGGYDGILTSRNFVKVDNLNNVTRGDVVIGDNSMGIWIGTKALFAGGATRPLTAITAAYRYKE